MVDDADSFSLDLGSEKPTLDPPCIHVYLASALTNIDGERDVRGEANRSREVIRKLLEGYDFEGIRFKVYDPAEHTSPGSPHSDDEVYRIDHKETTAADLVVFYVIAPSLGVGMEAQICAESTVPRVVIQRQASDVSRMFKGVFSPTIAFIEYDDLDDLRRQFSANLLEIATAVVRSAQERRGQLAAFCADAPGKKIMALRFLKGIPLADLAERTDIREAWLQRLERVPALAPSITLIQLHRIAIVLGTKASVPVEGVTTLATDESQSHLSDDQKKSLNNLVASTVTENPSDDQRLLRLWREYMQLEAEELDEALRHRGECARSVSVDEWRRRYHDQGGRLF